MRLPLGRRLNAFFVAAVLASPLLVLQSSPATALSGTSNIEAGSSFACALADSGAVYCWGANGYGALGDGTNTARSVPTLVSGGLTFSSVAASNGSGFACGLTTGGAAYCWGDNFNGRLGVGDTSNHNAPAAVVGGHTFISLSVGYSAVCGIVSGGTAYCWGVNNYGQLGVGNTTFYDTPTPVVGGLSFSKIAIGNTHACGVTLAGAAYCWGYNLDSELGDGTTNDSSSPVAVSGGHTFASITVGEDHSCAVTAAGVGYCWGFGGQGQLGNGGFSGASTPGAISGGLSFASLKAGRKSTCGVTTTNHGYCWGDNDHGQVGIGDTSGFHTAPSVEISGNRSWAAVDAGMFLICGTTTAGTVYCWGDGGYGQLGNDATNDSLSPVQALLFVDSKNTTVAVVVDPSLSFTVAGYNAGSCNGATITATSSTATDVALHPTTSVNSIGGQTLTVNTNASGGFTVYAKSNGALTDGSHTIADWSGTNGSPTTFSAAGTAGFGYSTDHNLSGTAARFQANKWAGFTTSNAEVAYLSAGPVSNDVTHVCLQAGIAAATVAGSYSTTLTYTALPSF